MGKNKVNKKDLYTQSTEFLKARGYKWNGRPVDEKSSSIYAPAHAGAPGLGKRA